jgi:hypothetical protein
MTPASILMRYRSWRGLRLQWHRPLSMTLAVRMMAVVMIAALPRRWRTGSWVWNSYQFYSRRTPPRSLHADEPRALEPLQPARLRARADAEIVQ